jgi:hypothetical protein
MRTDQAQSGAMNGSVQAINIVFDGPPGPKMRPVRVPQ